jgi:hypothetical protein
MYLGHPRWLRAELIHFLNLGKSRDARMSNLTELRQLWLSANSNPKPCVRAIPAIPCETILFALCVLFISHSAMMQPRPRPRPSQRAGAHDYPLVACFFSHLHVYSSFSRCTALLSPFNSFSMIIVTPPIRAFRNGATSGIIFRITSGHNLREAPKLLSSSFSSVDEA